MGFIQSARGHAGNVNNGVEGDTNTPTSAIFEALERSVAWNGIGNCQQRILWSLTGHWAPLSEGPAGSHSLRQSTAKHIIHYINV